MKGWVLRNLKKEKILITKKILFQFWPCLQKILVRLKHNSSIKFLKEETLKFSTLKQN